MVELGEPVEELLSDNGFGIELYSPHLDERREVGYFFGIGLHLASVGCLPALFTQSLAWLFTGWTLAELTLLNRYRKRAT